jgi:hypothetical protein
VALPAFTGGTAASAACSAARAATFVIASTAPAPTTAAPDLMKSRRSTIAHLQGARIAHGLDVDDMLAVFANRAASYWLNLAAPADETQ